MDRLEHESAELASHDYAFPVRYMLGMPNPDGHADDDDGA